MKDENYCTIGGRITHDPGIYAAPNGWLLSFSIANHSHYPANSKPMFIEVKVGVTNDRTKLDEFATRLPKGRKVTIHAAELQVKDWKPSDSDETKRSFHLFCRMDQIYLQDLPKKTLAAA